MKAFIQYLDYDLSGKLTEPCGDRAVVQLDGRQSLETWIQDGIKCNGFRRPVYPAFKIMKGDFHEAICLYASKVQPC